jgi:hypothetical protein
MKYPEPTHKRNMHNFTQMYKFFLSPPKLYTFHCAAFVSLTLPQTSMSQFYVHTT